MTMIDDIDTTSPDADIVDDETRTLVAPFELLEQRDGDNGDGLTLTGYAAVFNSPTRISSYEGEFVEQIAPGAFRHTLRNGKPVMQFDHGQHPLIGSLPIASIRKLKEDARGLYVEARVFDNWLTEPLRDAIREQAISGMSFRFSVVKDTWERPTKGDPVRTLNEVRLYELGPVVHPAYSDTDVALRSFERATGLAVVIPTINIDASTRALADGGSDGTRHDGDPAARQSTRTPAQRKAAVALRLTPMKGRPS
jgi:HK97 family phage prohead protease